MNQRQTDILQKITQLKEVKVTDLAEEFDVSEVTIRKDLNYLEDNGLINREHGFAKINESDDIRIRLAQNYPIKQKIAREAANLINDGDYVLIESGSCCSLLALELAKTKNDITIITNSAFIADYIHKESNIKVILLGGEYQMESQVTVGPVMSEVLKQFNVNLAFIGIDGYKDGVFSSNDLMRTQAVKDFAKQAEKTVVLTDSTKFFDQSRFNHLNSNQIATVITDINIPNEKKEEIENNGTELILVK